MTPLQESVFRDYIHKHSLPQIYKALLAGLCISCPEDPLHFIEQKIKSILEEQDLDMHVFIDKDKQIFSLAGRFVYEIFGDSDDSLNAIHLFEKAYTYYRSSLTKMSFRGWRFFIWMKKVKAAKLLERLKEARIYHNQRKIKLAFVKWRSWVRFYKQRQKDAARKLQKVQESLHCRNLIKAWRHVVCDAKRSRDYFKRVERGLQEGQISEGDGQDKLSLLPKKLYLKIFQSLGVRDLLKCSHVCHCWKAIAQTSSLWTEMDFSPESSWISDHVVERILRLHRVFVTSLNLRACTSIQNPTFIRIRRNHADDFRGVSLSPKSQSGLHLYHKFHFKSPVKITDDGFRSIAEICNTLQQISLNDLPNLTDTSVQVLQSKFHNLRLISLLNSPCLSDAAFKTICKSITLTKLQMRGNNKITDSSLKSLCRSCVRLSELRVSKCPHITDASLKSLGALPKLCKLNISGSVKVTDMGILYVTEGPSAVQLQHLDLSYCPRVTDLSLRKITQKCSTLTQLSLCFCESLTDNGFESLEAWPSLVSLDITGCKIQDYGLAALGACPSLRQLTAAGCLCLTDTGIKCPHLELLDVSHCVELSDKAIKALSFFCRTTSIVRIAGCPKMTDTAVKYLTRAGHFLRELDVSGCPLLTDSSATFLHSSCLHLRSISMLYCKNISREQTLSEPQPGKNLKMWKETCVALLLLICVELCGRPDPTLNPRIIGGQNVTQGAWPWMASLHKRHHHICGGSLITKQWVLTAAHCVNGETASKLTVYLGLWKQEEIGDRVAHKVSSIHIYGDAYIDPHDDIALLHLSTAVNFTRTPNIKPMCLADEGSSFPANISSWVIGWGAIRINIIRGRTGTTIEPVWLPDSDPLQEVEVKVYSYQKCKNYCLNFSAKMMCTGTATGRKSTENGDSGGPLMSKNESVWVQSGVIKGGFVDCTEPGPISFYTRVSEYKSWIKNITTRLKLILNTFPTIKRDTDEQTFTELTHQEKNLKMWKETCVALLLLICVERSLSDYSKICGRPDPTLTGRIRGGQNATQGAWPWMASLHKTRHICGGSLITKQWVLTAAHCVNGTKASDLTVYLGLWKQAELRSGVAYKVSSIH
ncbi:hypothetical protein DNTS_016198, partial [Danionella cerebrum]